MTPSPVAGALLVPLLATPAAAQCVASVPFGNFLETVAHCDDGGPLSGTVKAVDAFGQIVSTTDDSFICLAPSQPGCSGTLAGLPADGQVAFVGDWASPRVDGCPVGGPARGRNFYNVRDASGRLLLLSVGFDPRFGSYFADWAWPADGSSLACGDPRTGISVVSESRTGNRIALRLRLQTPPIASDCDPGSRGIANQSGSCAQGDLDLLAAIAPQNLYVTGGACDGSDLNYDILRGNGSPSPSPTTATEQSTRR